MSSRVRLSLLIFVLPFQVFAADPILEWIDSLTTNEKLADVSYWSPGFSIFEETQLRLDVDDKDYLIPEQTVRVTLKPLGGIGNELKLSKQLKKVSALESQSLVQSSRLRAYHLVLYYWKLHHSLKVVNGSENLFMRAKNRLSVIQKERNIDFNIAKYLRNISQFFKLQMIVKEEYKKIGQMVGNENKTLILERIEDFPFLSLDRIADFLVKNDFSAQALELDSEKRKLKQLEFQKEKSESRQLLKFVNVSRESRFNRHEDYKFQVAFRVPFLSDNLEFEKAKRDYLLEDQKLAQVKVSLGRELEGLKSEILGAIAEVKILKNLPQTSHNSRLIKSSLSSMSTAVSGEMEFVEAKLDLVQSRYSIYEKYLTFLSLSRLLQSKNTNYLVQSPKL